MKSLTRPRFVDLIIEDLPTCSDKLIDYIEDLEAQKDLALYLSNIKGYDSIASALESIDSNMKTLESLRQQYTSLNDMGRDLGVHPYQLSRLIKQDALYIENGVIYIPSKTKLKFKF